MLRLVSILGFIALWQLGAHSTNAAFFVSLPQALSALWELFMQHHLLQDVAASFRRVSIAVLMSFLIALPLGITIGRHPMAERLTEPLTRFLRYVPAPTLIPLAILWFGVGELAKIFIVFWGIFFVVLLSVRDAAQHVPAAFLLIAQSMGYSRIAVLRRVVLPAIAPEVWNTLRVAWGEAWIYLIIAEIIAADNGLGKTLIVAQRFLRVDQIFGILLLIGGIGLTSDWLFRALRPWLFPYKYPR